MVPARVIHEGVYVLEVRHVAPFDPLVVPMFAELDHEYRSRYGSAEDVSPEMTRYSLKDFRRPGGGLVLLVDAGAPVAGGAFRRHDDDTAEFKRIWTAAAHRRRGLARRVLVELESEARRRGYTRVHLATGPRQPEATALYLASGYTPLYEVTLPAEQVGEHAFEKKLPPLPPL